MGRSPKNRVDDYPSTIKDKITEIFEIANNKNSDFIVLGGDFFENYNTSISVIRDTLQFFKELSDKNNIPIYSALGNHDLHGNIKTMSRSAISIFDTAQTIEISDKKNKIRFLHYFTGIEKFISKNKSSNLEIPKNMEDIYEDDVSEVWVVHAMINNTPLKHIVNHITIYEVDVPPNVKLVLTGHYHGGYPITKRADGVVFANPGALSRRSATQDNLKRKIQVVHVEKKNEEFAIEYIGLKSCKPADEVFDLETIKAKKEDKEKFFSYIDKLQELEMESGETTNLEDELNKFAKEADLESDLLDEILGRLRELNSEE
jgi:DNA repair exonuclease SbcCD nuclease subunit